MNRLLSMMVTDFRIQLRMQLYLIGIGASVVLALALGILSSLTYLPVLLPVLLLATIGGSTLLYAAVLVVFEKEQGTLIAQLASPLHSREYLWAKIVSLSTLAIVESLVMVGGTLVLIGQGWPFTAVEVLFLFLGIVSLSIVYSLVGLILVVRYQTLMEFLLPLAFITSLLQLPVLRFLGLSEHPIFLLIPTCAPTLLIQGAFHTLNPAEWTYGLGYTAITIIILTAWMYRAYRVHILEFWRQS
ncbi:fluoroquinolone export ABC transporter permease subunit [Microbulbifer spongiae]|uniref:ABC transporter permease n=1 Tax=Microbulbifer spongiae TaxID=2944933 RepID=A0ABY9E583_9GAMM|nr:ABC transporter permease [Microbulbifer sp. MI-G]WKD48178.1 ABC transporter permease [Microbulbifer sp. MI-G]